MFVLMDLERTIGSGRAFYWKQNQRGYTTDIEEAGRFSEFDTNIIVSSDFDNRTVAIAEDTIKDILR